MWIAAEQFDALRELIRRAAVNQGFLAARQSSSKSMGLAPRC